MNKTGKEKDKTGDTFKTITVRWADHWQDDGDYTLAEIKKKAQPYYGEWTGKLLLETKQMLVLGGNMWEARPDNDEEEPTWSEPMYIMKRSIVWRSDKDAK